MGVTYANGQLPLPNGAYGYSGNIYVEGLSPSVEEWSASKSPYYTYGDIVKHNGLVYQLNYAWDGTTVGSPSTQVDTDGNRVWSLATGAGAGHEQYYNELQLKNLLSGPTKQWGLRPCHQLFYNIFPAPLYTENLFDASMQKDPLPKAYYNNTSGGLSVDVGAAKSIPANLFKLVLTDGASHPSSSVGTLVGGIFEQLKDYPYTNIFTGNEEPLGALYYEETFSYTLTTDNWWMMPEYTEPSPLPTRTFTYTDTSGATVNRTKTMWMIFIPETFLGRTYNGAFRVYRRTGHPTQLIERMELDTVTPDLLTD